MKETQKRRTVISQEVILKTFLPDLRRWYENEVYFYTKYTEFAPCLIGRNDETLTLVIEKCAPLRELARNIQYREPLRELLQKFHEAGANHRDAAIINVVVHPVRGVLLIDFEHATENIGPVSMDLYGCTAAGKVNDCQPNQGEDGVHWNGPHTLCPGLYRWKE